MMSAPSRLLSWITLIALGILLEIASASLAYHVTFDQLIGELRDSGQHRLDLYASSLEREIGQYAYFPKVVGLDQKVSALLADPANSALAKQVDIYLEHLNEHAGTMDIYLMTPGGKVIATSNWNQADSFLGRDLSYRPYVKAARPGHVEGFYGIGTTHNDPGYYLSSALVDKERVTGVAAVKVSLDQLEKSWLSAESPALLSDDNGVIVLSSVAAWKYTTLRKMDAAVLRHLDETQQYNRRRLTPLGLVERKVIDANSRIVELHNRGPRNAVYATDGLFLAQSRSMNGTPWHLTVFYDLRKTNDLAMSRAALAALGTALGIAMLVLVRARRRARRERHEARFALQRAYAELELKVDERTSELSHANTHLQHEIRERSEAVRTLKAAQDELVQAGKLAVIGQLAAGIAHELNQPLAALGTLSSNASEFLERGDIATAQFNLGRIALLVQRMGTLTGQLRSFARRSGDELGAVDIAHAVDNALGILDPRLRKAGVTAQVVAPGHAVIAHCNAVRLEQVLVNLLSNAIEASQDKDPPWVRVSWEKAGERALIHVCDNGTGMTETVLSKLFEPFYTTKATGLGLGLAISSGIIRDFGGELAAKNRATGGAEFSIDLPLSQHDEAEDGKV
ncbi:sensor histidine kinase [Paludibacterium yongneupense]|uniref:sensor histidine kinase n=1 Tax=Paludibacterium yongneupense TaxID=400061 RepID=UPI00040D7DF1|nr:ATP-binding protein [Paludibacterium yongneupense]